MTCKQKGGGEEAWEAKRWSERDVPREEGKITSFAFKDKAIFARVSDNNVAKKAAWVEGARTEALAASQPQKYFDGAMTYIPPPSIGADYMTQHEVDRMLRAREGEHRLEVIASLEARVEKLAAAAAGGAEDAKPKLELAQKLLRGEKQWDKLAERGAWKGGAGAFTPASSKHAEHLPDAYRTELELMRDLHKEDLKRPEKDKERLEKEIPALEAALAAGKGDADQLKRRLEVAQKLLKGVKGAAKLQERVDFKPTSVRVVTDARCAARCSAAAPPTPPPASRCAPHPPPLLPALHPAASPWST